MISLLNIGAAQAASDEGGRPGGQLLPVRCPAFRGSCRGGACCHGGAASSHCGRCCCPNGRSRCCACGRSFCCCHCCCLQQASPKGCLHCWVLHQLHAAQPGRPSLPRRRRGEQCAYADCLIVIMLAFVLVSPFNGWVPGCWYCCTAAAEHVAMVAVVAGANGTAHGNNSPRVLAKRGSVLPCLAP